MNSCRGCPRCWELKDLKSKRARVKHLMGATYGIVNLWFGGQSALMPSTLGACDRDGLQAALKILDGDISRVQQLAHGWPRKAGASHFVEHCGSRHYDQGGLVQSTIRAYERPGLMAAPEMLDNDVPPVQQQPHDRPRKAGADHFIERYRDPHYLTS